MSAIALEVYEKISAEMEVQFGIWLAETLKARGISQADLARLSGLSRQAISDYINLKRTNPDSDALAAIARGLKMPRETVYRAAGLLPPISEEDALIEQITNDLNRLSPRRRQQALDFIQYLASRQTPEEGEEAAS